MGLHCSADYTVPALNRCEAEPWINYKAERIWLHHGHESAASYLPLLGGTWDAVTLKIADIWFLLRRSSVLNCALIIRGFVLAGRVKHHKVVAVVRFLYVSGWAGKAWDVYVTLKLSVRGTPQRQLDNINLHRDCGSLSVGSCWFMCRCMISACVSGNALLCSGPVFHMIWIHFFRWNLAPCHQNVLADRKMNHHFITHQLAPSHIIIVHFPIKLQL